MSIKNSSRWMLMIGVLGALGILSAAAARAEEPPAPAEAHEHHAALGIPPAIQAEHGAIHAALVEATRSKGRVGAAAKALAEVLHPHFVREEEIALPPLGLLAPLAEGERPEAEMRSVLLMTDSLKAELPTMLEEHGKIRAAVEKLLVAAKAEKNVKAERLARELALHAQTEEQVLYPAAILVGDVIRVRLAAQ